MSAFNADIGWWRPALSVAPYVTLDNRLSVLPPLDPIGGLLLRVHV